MSDKNFLQELQALKREIEYAHNEYIDEHDEISVDVDEALKICVEHIQDMINHCIEIQLAVMKDDRTKEFYKKRDV